MNHSKRIAGLILILAVAGCRKEGVQTYRVPKETPAAMPMVASQPMDLPPDHPPIGSGMGGDMQAMGAGMKPEGSAKEISWTVPEGWQEQPPSSMRVGSFLIKGADGKTADMSVIPLSGMAGGDLANINRWRGQINLGPISETELPSQSETIQPGGRRMLLVDFANENRRLLSAIYKRGDRTWFFKMTGDDATARAAKPAFLQFLKSLKFHENNPQ